MRWLLSNRADPRCCEISNRHYSRQKPGTPQFVPPGRCVVLRSVCGRAVWVTSWPYAEYVKHAWAGAWMCSFFRNEGAGLSSELIREAVAVTRWVWPDVPTLGMLTFIDAAKVRSTNPGCCYRKAGFRSATPRTTAGGLVAVQLVPEDMPQAEAPLGASLRLFEDARAGRVR